MKLLKLDDDIALVMTSDEYGDMCKFMIANGVGYGMGRTLSNKWRDAREEFKKEGKK